MGGVNWLTLTTAASDRQSQKNNKNAWDIAESICKMAEEGKKSGCRVVFISGVLPRWGKKYEKMINRVNSMVEVMCRDHGYIFLDHGDISTRHLSNDGLHPNAEGTAILKMNILSCFEGFEPTRTSFYEFYRSAVS